MTTTNNTTRINPNLDIFCYSVDADYALYYVVVDDGGDAPTWDDILAYEKAHRLSDGKRESYSTFYRTGESYLGNLASFTLGKWENDDLYGSWYAERHYSVIGIDEWRELDYFASNEPDWCEDEELPF